jgi:hypothetical protein
MNPPSTPPRAGPSTPTETPSRPRQYGSNRYLTGVLDEARSIVVEDLGDIPLFPVDSFIERVLPPAKEPLLEEVKALLVQRKHINNQKRWDAFSKTPKQSGKSETNAFKTLPTVFKNIVTAVSRDSKARPHFVYNPNDAPASERNNDTRPDGQLELTAKKSLGNRVGRLRSEDTKSRWEDIVVPFEFKLDEKDFLDVSLLYGLSCPRARVTHSNSTLRNSSGVPTMSCGLTHAAVFRMESQLKIRECACGFSHDPTSWCPIRSISLTRASKRIVASCTVALTSYLRA